MSNALEAIAAQKRGRRKPVQKDDPGRLSMPKMGLNLAVALFTALNTPEKRWPANFPAPKGLSPEGMNFFLKLKRDAPVKFSEHLMQIVKAWAPQDGDAEPVRYLIQQINITAAPVAGVLNSPIAGHIAPAALAEVVEAAEPEPSAAARALARLMAAPPEPAEEETEGASDGR